MRTALFFLVWFIAQSVFAQSEALVQDTAYIDPVKEYDNQSEKLKASGHTFDGGPGPFTVHFRADLTRKPDYVCWELAEDNNFNIIIDRFRTLEYDSLTSVLDYEFRKNGKFFMRFVADFDTGSPDSVSYSTRDPYTITLSESLLEVPNLITPDSPTGKNRTFKVRYQALVSYEIWIYNRWGQQLFHSSDPTEEWDGRYNGSVVPTGAYYYVIKAMGTDDKEYVKKGAINVLKTKGYGTQQ